MPSPLVGFTVPLIVPTVGLGNNANVLAAEISDGHPFGVATNV